MTIEKAAAAFMSSSWPRTILLMRSMPGESSFESDIVLPEVWEMGVWVGLWAVGCGWSLSGLICWVVGFLRSQAGGCVFGSVGW